MTQTDPVSPAQSRAAHAYADVMLAAEVAGAAADDAIAAFRQTLGARGESGAAGPPAANETLLALTRLMTAVSLPDRSSPEERRQAVWASLGSSSHCTCREAAALLATRANGNIQPRESAALDEHLARCADCRELSVRSVAADRAFRAVLAPPSRRRGGVPGGPRAGAGLLAVLIAVAVGIFALSSGGSGSGGAHAATVPVQIQTAEAAAPRSPAVAKPTAPARHTVHHPARRTLAAKPRTAHRPTHTVAESPPATPPAEAGAGAGAGSDTAATDTASASAPSAAAAGGEAADGAAADSATSAPPSSAGTSSASGESAPSTAAAVSGPSGLPADSAPQQGIGSLTTTTP